MVYIKKKNISRLRGKKNACNDVVMGEGNI